MVQGVTNKPKRAEELQPPPPPPPPPPPAPPAASSDAPASATTSVRPGLQTRLDASHRFNVESGGNQRALALQNQFDTRGSAGAPTGPAAPNGGAQPGEPAPGGATYTQTGDRQYRLTAGSNSANVTVGEGVDPNTVLPKIAGFYGSTPPDVRASIENIDVRAEQGRLIESTEDPNDRAAATGGNGTITFYDGDKNLDQGIFNHEAAHLVGYDRNNADDSIGENLGELFSGNENNDYVPDGYRVAAQQDGNSTSSYAEASHGSTGYTEDFAEGYRAYRDAIASGPAGLEAFRSQYPHRAAWFEENYPA